MGKKKRTALDSVKKRFSICLNMNCSRQKSEPVDKLKSFY